MAAISDFESDCLLKFFKSHPQNEEKVIEIAKTITKNCLKDLQFDGEKCQFHSKRKI
jgi:hypothetical protein